MQSLLLVLLLLSACGIAAIASPRSNSLQLARQLVALGAEQAALQQQLLEITHIVGPLTDAARDAMFSAQLSGSLNNINIVALRAEARRLCDARARLNIDPCARIEYDDARDECVTQIDEDAQCTKAREMVIDALLALNRELNALSGKTNKLKFAAI